MASTKIVSVQLDGLARFINHFHVATADLLPAMGAVFFQEATVIADAADLLVPYDSGDLARSQDVHQPAIQGSSVFVEITYGGPSEPYAIEQHENEEFSHPSKASGLPPNGRQSHYLEEPFDDRIDSGALGPAMAARIEKLLIQRMGL